jgi:hypothetical protein
MAVVAPKFSGDIMQVTALVDTRHDFGDTSKDYAKEIGAAGVNQYDCFQNFTNNIQRHKLFGDGAAARGLSQRLTSTCKARGNVLGTSPEAEFVTYVEGQIGLPNNPGNLEPARIVIGGLQLNGNGAGGVSNGNAAGLGQGFVKVIIPSQTNFPVANPDESYNILAGGQVDYQRYHRAIARALGWTDDARNPIPVVVDTTKSLQYTSDPYFIICRNRENITDPGPSSDMFFPFVAEERVADVANGGARTYTINGVRHKVSGAIAAPTITYTFSDAQGGGSVTYTYGARGNKSPNSIEVCKAKIKDAVEEIINASAGTGVNYYQTYNGGDMPVAGTVAGLVALFNRDCDIYNRLGYRNINIGAGDDNIENRIVVPYVAKRGGDQLQAESCNSRITYVLKRSRNIRGPQGGNMGQEYVNVNINGDISDVEIPVDIENCIFWTYDRVAAIYAVLRGITTVLQNADKTAIIYKQVARPTAAPFQIPLLWPPPPAVRQMGGRIPRPLTKLKGGVMCLRGTSNAENRGNGPVGPECFFDIFEKLCTPITTTYDPFSLLNFINYYLDTHFYMLNINRNPLNSPDFNNLTLSIDGCICQEINWGFQQVIPDGRVLDIPNTFQPAAGWPAAPYNILFLRFNELHYTIKYIGGANKTIRIDFPTPRRRILNSEYNLIGVDGILSQIIVPDAGRDNYFNYIARRNEGQIGGGANFYQKWAELQKSYKSDAANKLFIEFLELLSLCENQYFVNRDSADNFYVYNSIPVLHGGHTQYQMMAFFDTIIRYYNDRKLQSSKLDTLLKCFIYFPFLLQNAELDVILKDLSAYISLWFEFEMVMNKDIKLNEEVNTLFKTIINDTSKTLQKLQSELSGSDEKCADSLYKIFPHGYFVIKYNEIKPTKNTTNLIIPTRSNTVHNLKNIHTTRGKKRSFNNNSGRPAPELSAPRQGLTGGKRTTKKRRKNKRKTHKKRKY